MKNANLLIFETYKMLQLKPDTSLFLPVAGVQFRISKIYFILQIPKSTIFIYFFLFSSSIKTLVFFLIKNTSFLTALDKIHFLFESFFEDFWANRTSKSHWTRYSFWHVIISLRASLLEDVYQHCNN